MEARSVVDKKNCQFVFDKAKLKLATTYLLDNRCFTVWNSTFREMIGIPMGLHPVPFMANLFLHSFNLHKTRGLTNAFGFIDDMRSINENGFQTFQNYPEELELKKENISSTKDSFLDTDLEMKDDKI